MNERHVIKVPKSEPMGGDIPQMPMNSPNMQPPMGDEGMNEPMDNFGNAPDMGDAPNMDNTIDDNGDDRIKEIQELSGELSQKLRELNAEKHNKEISDYALNMVKSAAKGDDSNNQQNSSSQQNEGFNESINQIIGNKKTDDRKQKKLPNKPKRNPFVSNF